MASILKSYSLRIIVFSIVLFTRSIVSATDFPSGFTYPTDTIWTDNGDWLSAGQTEYEAGKYHVGRDIAAVASSNVYALAPGHILKVFTSTTDAVQKYMWFEYNLIDGSHFYAVYGHINSSLTDGNYFIPVSRGQQIATIADYPPYGSTDGDHLHLGIRPAGIWSGTIPTGWGRGTIPIEWDGNKNTLDTNGFVAPWVYLSSNRPHGYIEPADIWWVSTPINNQWYRNDAALTYNYKGTDVVLSEIPHTGDLNCLYLSDAGLGWHVYSARAWNSANDKTIAWEGGWDNQAPSIFWTSDCAMPRTWLSGPQYARWNSQDEHAGVKACWSQWNDGAFNFSEDEFSLLPEGKNSLRILSEDNSWYGSIHSGNISTICADFWLDNTPPLVSVTCPVASTWLTDIPLITWDVTDTTSGLATLMFQWDNGEISTIDACGFLTILEGIHEASLHATDTAGNNITITFGPFFVDTSPPTTPTIFTPSVSQSTRALAFSYAAVDAQSGIINYEYIIGTTEGGIDINKRTSTGATPFTSVNNLSLALGNKCYVTVWAQNGAGLWSEPVTSQAITVTEGDTVEGIFNAGGTSAVARQSANYRLTDTLGQFMVGSTESMGSSSSVLLHGLWPSLPIINTPPSFTKGADITVLQTTKTQSYPNWATAISAGEEGQTVDFLVSVDHPEYFDVQPAISATGTLSFTPKATASGVATITVRLHDDGGGTDTSDPQTFTITICQTLSNVTLAADPANTPLAGHDLTFIATPVGGFAPEYTFSAKLKDVQPNGTSTYTTIIPVTAIYDTVNTCIFPATDPGMYTVTVKCREIGTGTSYTKSLNYLVGTNTLTGVTSLTADQPSGIAMDALPAGGIGLSATVSGTVTGVQYFFSATLKDIRADGTFTMVPVTLSTAWGGPTFAWHPTEPGSYTLKVVARDASCNISYSKTLAFLVKAAELTGIAAFTADPASPKALDEIPVGGITLTATPQGSGTGVEYFFSAKLKDIAADGTFSMVPVALSTGWGGNTFAWHPTAPGTYTVTVTARDASYNTTVMKSLNYTVKAAELKGVATFTANPPSGTALDALPLGGIMLTATADGAGTGVQYFFSAKLKDIAANGTFISTAVTLSTVWGGNTFSWTPTQPGTYTLTVAARDASCDTKLTKTLSYTVKAAELKGVATFTANPPSGTALDAIPGGGITLTATPDGSGTGVQYFFSAKLKDIAADGTYTTAPVVLSTVWGGNTFPWTPTEPGAYTLMVAARDASCNTTFTKTLAYTVKAATVKGITSFLASLPSGTALDAIPGAGIQLTVTPDGSGTGVEYFYSAKLKDVQADGSYTLVPIILSTVWGSNTYAWHPTEPGAYTLTVVARDASCNTSYSKTLSFTVLSPTLKGITSFTPSFPSGKALALIPPEGVLFTALLNGSGTDVQYRYKVGKMVPGVGYSYTPLTTYTGDHTYLFPPAEFTPLTVGSYTVAVYAWDGSYNTTFSKTASYVVK